ncbi:MAG: type IV pili methyl-accepting chemotaxis transducer N-terminal domain-containing protein [Burkholderiales bacterium]|nr:type IV pili methyl-accepting chemotaxis transducer N-terminal domain-containing protein [Burkholderiales bacterium]
MELPARARRGGIATKLIGIALAFLVVALAAIGMTLLQSWKLEGAAAAINDMGSARMRSYRVALLGSELARAPRDTAIAAELRAVVQDFESTLDGVRQGDPARPIALPTDAAIAVAVANIAVRWQHDFRPIVDGILADPAGSEARAEILRRKVDGFVAAIDDVVDAIERDNASVTSWLRSFQLILVAGAVLGTVALIYLMYLLVVRPVTALQQGIGRLAAEDFSARVPVESDDEFGALGRAFNTMADHLQGVYATLESKIAEKTRSLESRNRELTTLFDATTALNEAADIQALCGVSLKLILSASGAAGGAVRLRESGSGDLHIHATEGLSPELVRAETCEHARDCTCGRSALHDQPIVEAVADDPGRHCAAAGYRGMAAFPIRHERQVLGVFNLYFAEPRLFLAREQRLFVALGQQIGAALQALRLRSVEREMAVSDERNLLARELHDSIAQSLAFLNLQTQMLDDSLRSGRLGEARAEVGRIREGVQESYDDVRELLTHFRLRVADTDLAGALKQSLVRFEAQTGIRTEFVESGSGIEPPAEAQVQVLHVIQEALSNARKHANATTTTVNLERGPVYRFTVRDDGRGFDASRRDSSGSHVGLAIMRERAHRIGATLDVRSTAGSGTRVVLSLPVATTEAAA